LAGADGLLPNQGETKFCWHFVRYGDVLAQAKIRVYESRNRCFWRKVTFSQGDSEQKWISKVKGGFFFERKRNYRKDSRANTRFSGSPLTQRIQAVKVGFI
jgi:hypothetical protein